MMRVTIAADAALPRLGLEEAYCLHRDAVFRFCVSQLHDPHLAEDAAADVFAIAMRSWDRIEEGQGHLPWLLGIARRVTARQRRTAARRARLAVRAASGGQEQPDVGEQVVVRDRLRAVLAAMAGLRERERVLIGLRIAAGLSYAEIGEVEQLSEGTARVAVHRALKALRQRMEDREP